MADDKPVADTTDSGSTPEPLPDNIADTELDGLKPADASTDEQQVETEQDETQQDQQTDDDTSDDADDSESSTDEQDEDTEDAQPQDDQQPEAAEPVLTGKERRLAEKAERNYINEQRAAIREAEQSLDPQDTARRMEILEAKQYVDTVERNRASIVNDNIQAQAVIPMFNPSAKEFNQVAYEAALKNFNDNYIVTDNESGEVLGAVDRNGNNVSLFNHMQQQAALYEQLVSNTRTQTQKSETKMRAKAVNPSNPGKVTSSGDELADLLDKIGDVPLV